MTATIEDEVRTMLARRALDVPDDGSADVGLPTGLRIAVDGRRPSDPGRTRWLAVAAAVVAVLGLAGVLVRSGSGDGTERTDATTDPTSTAVAPTGERPGHLSLLPDGVDPTSGPVRGLADGASTPEEAADAFVAEAFDEDVAPSAPFEWGADASEVWAAYRTPLVDLDPDAWPGMDADDVMGTVTARATDEGWVVVAVTSAALDLTDVRYDGTRVTGEVRSTSSAPLRVIVSSSTGEQLAKSDLTTSTFSGTGPSALELDDIEVASVGRPVTLRVEAGDRTGQVGIDGVRVAAVASVVLPGAMTGATPPPDLSSDTIDSVDLPTDSPLAESVRALLPPGHVISEVFHSSGPGLDWVGLTATSTVDGGGYFVGVHRLPLLAAMTEGYERWDLPWGRVWVAPTDPATGDGVHTVYAEGPDGVVVDVARSDLDGEEATADALIAIAERLVADPVVARVAAGGDPNG